MRCLARAGRGNFRFRLVVVEAVSGDDLQRRLQRELSEKNFKVRRTPQKGFFGSCFAVKQ
jgi:hypothetical protein